MFLSIFGSGGQSGTVVVIVLVVVVVAGKVIAVVTVAVADVVAVIQRHSFKVVVVPVDASPLGQLGFVLPAWTLNSRKEGRRRKEVVNCMAVSVW